MFNQESVHEQRMRLALACAHRGWGKTHPNPLVGAVIFEGDDCVAKGWHERAGEAHAERMVLDNLGRKPKANAILYVTLEPCSTQGRTGACTELIIQSGIKKVVVGAIDPNPEHAGRGIDILVEAGLEVTGGLLSDECEDLNLIFNHQMLHAKPFFAAKVATTLDGRIATRTRDSKWITGEAARQDVMRWRRYFPAIAVGAGTVLADDPRLTSRVSGQDVWCPKRFIFDRSLKTTNGKTYQLVSDDYKGNTVIVTSEQADADCLARVRDWGVDVVMLPEVDGGVCLSSFRDYCRGLCDAVLFEGGASLLKQLIQGQHLDYLLAYRAPKILADEESLPIFSGLVTKTMTDAVELKKIRQQMFADDQLMRGFINYGEQKK